MNVLQDWLFVAGHGSGHTLGRHWRLIRWSRMRAYRVSLLAQVLRTISKDLVLAFRERLAENGEKTKAGKYFDLASHFARALSEADHLGVINSKPGLRVMDLGTGCGYFPYVCRYLGHEITTIDKQEGKYGYAREQLGVPAHLWEMTPESPLPDLGQQFDLITAFQPVFFLYRPEGFGNPWNQDMWEKFFQGLRPALADGGRFYLGANDMSRADKRAYEEMLKYFEKKKSDRVSDGWLFSKEHL